MRMSLEDEIRSIAEEMIKKLSQITLFDKSNKERFKDILIELKEDREIINFLPNSKDRRFKDFVVIIENKGKYDTVGIAIKEREDQIGEYMRRQNQLREQISQYRKFMERFVVVVNKNKTDENLKQQWAKALKLYRES